VRVGRGGLEVGIDLSLFMGKKLAFVASIWMKKTAVQESWHEAMLH